VTELRVGKHAAQGGLRHAGAGDEAVSPFDQARVVEGEQTVLEHLRRRAQRSDVGDLLERARQVGGRRPVGGHPHGHRVGVVPEQLDGRKRRHVDGQHAPRVRQVVAQALGGDAGQHQLGHHEQDHDQPRRPEGP
jgi:hypothetical protein